jgi:hypothetical protein
MCKDTDCFLNAQQKSRFFITFSLNQLLFEPIFEDFESLFKKGTGRSEKLYRIFRAYASS